MALLSWIRAPCIEAIERQENYDFFYDQSRPENILPQLFSRETIIYLQNQTSKVLDSTTGPQGIPLHDMFMSDILTHFWFIHC